MVCWGKLSKYYHCTSLTFTTWIVSQIMAVVKSLQRPSGQLSGLKMIRTLQNKKSKLTFKCKTEKNVLVMSLKYTPIKQRILCLNCLMSVQTIKHLNNGGQESKKKKKFALYDSDTPVTLKQGEGH